jgi:DNA polymerase (family 10)
MAEAARALGLGYLAATPSDPDPKRLSARLDEIDRLNETLDGFRLLKSAEVGVLADGRLDLPDGLLKRLDIVVCSVRSRFDLDREAQTDRLVRAMDNRYCQIVGHPTGQEGYAVDVDRLIAAAKARGRHLELSADPAGMGLDDVHCRSAKVQGVKIAIGSGARSAAGLQAMRFAVDQARRGWLEPGDVLNCRPWPELKKLLAH